jgi:murein L,D-transpeptidase YcbB/YkuD
MKIAKPPRDDARFREQIEAQMGRLLQQLADLDEFRLDLEKEEYDETLADTKQQLVEFKEALDKITEGDVTLMDALSRMRVAIQAAISDAFKTPEVVAMFMKKEPGQLRQRLQQLETALKLRKIGPDAYAEQQVEVLTALQRLGESLSPAEEASENCFLFFFLFFLFVYIFWF